MGQSFPFIHNLIGLMSAITLAGTMILARPRILIKVTFLKHFALEVWVSIVIKIKSNEPEHLIWY